MLKTVELTVTYQCGRCDNLQRRVLRSKDGLLEIPNVYCGCCLKHNWPVIMSMTYSGARVIDPPVPPKPENPDRVPTLKEMAGAWSDGKAETAGLGGRSEVPASGKETAPAEGQGS